MDWWKEKFKLPKGYKLKERMSENDKTVFIVTVDNTGEKWVSYDIVDGELVKYKAGKSPLDVRKKQGK